MLIISVYKIISLNLILGVFFMGSIRGISCAHCDFNMILEGLDSFYVDHKTDELIEYILLMLTRIDEENKISGHIERTYCSDCDKLIKTYVINESKYSEEESINRLEEIIKKSDINDKEQIEFYSGLAREKPNECIIKFMKNENILPIVLYEPIDENSIYEDSNCNRKINCPQCGKKLYRNFHEIKCPICGNYLDFGFGGMLD